MAATPPALLLAEEQRRLLDQFEFHVIQERGDTSVVWVGSAMRSGPTSTNNGSVSGTTPSSSASSGTSSPFACAPSVAPSKAVPPDSEQVARVTRFDLTAPHGGGRVPPLTGAKCDPLQRMEPAQSGVAMNSRAQELEAPTPPSLHVIAAAPLLHDNLSIRKGDLASPVTGVSVSSSHQPSRGWRTHVGGDSAVPLGELLRHVDADALTGATQTSVDEKCKELAERLLRMSAEADAVALAMNHDVVSPLEFF
ncbi:hypothetical protein LDHU3_32.3520:CDS1 [Leishmania donovani]|uniref:Hypothetical_protein n=1 Tax=Leishmania donovani TaxID=5661 RepID=A0A3S7X5W6_LEIDO|nr:hypothetical protein LdCL_320033800 [Leishmania donovani]CAJ1991814.1 hypothetical protein LDHU3_32.3520:CDS1 [Leishmania donovani]VDZ47653.1 hypothetical_protein [Leishmania donovani]